MNMRRHCDFILLAEDEPDDELLFRRAFAEAHWSIPLRVIRNGAELKEYLTASGAFANRSANPLPSLLLLDLKLPGYSGHEILSWLRSQQGSLRRLPVMMMSSSSHPKDVDQAYELGANSYFVKPSSFDQLVQTIRVFKAFWLACERPEI